MIGVKHKIRGTKSTREWQVLNYEDSGGPAKTARGDLAKHGKGSDTNQVVNSAAAGPKAAAEYCQSSINCRSVRIEQWEGRQRNTKRCSTDSLIRNRWRQLATFEKENQKPKVTGVFKRNQRIRSRKERTREVNSQ